MPSPSQRVSSAPDWVAYIDGGSRGNPGPAGYGVVFQDSRRRVVKTLCRFLGQATNNAAEYQALLAALEYAVKQQVRRLKVYCDSELVARQMQGRYRVQSPELKPLYLRAQELASRLLHFSIEHIPREQNREADRLANQAMDEGESGPSARFQTFSAVAEDGRLRPLPPLPALEEGAEYEVRAQKRASRTGPDRASSE